MCKILFVELLFNWLLCLFALKIIIINANCTSILTKTALFSWDNSYLDLYL